MLAKPLLTELTDSQLLSTACARRQQQQQQQQQQHLLTEKL
jgi:hypothetical protein